MKITFDNLFGIDGLIPIQLYVGIGNGICPHCQSQLNNIGFPPPRIIIIHSCPVCRNLFIPFLRKIVPIKKEIFEIEQTIARRHITDSLFAAISPILIKFIETCGVSDTKKFLEDCWNVLYNTVGEKEDKDSIMEKVRSMGMPLTQEFDFYFEKLFEIKAPKQEGLTNQQIDKLKQDLDKVESVDDFLKKFF